MALSLLTTVSLHAAEPPAFKPAPPEMVVGVTRCGNIVAVWIFAHEQVRRVDSGNAPTDPVEQGALAAYIESALQTDVVEEDCPSDKGGV